MSRYLQDIAVGGYMPGDTFLHRMDPRAKLAAFVVTLAIVLTSDELRGIALSIPLTILPMVACRAGGRVWWWGLSRFSWMLGIAALMHLFLTSEGRPVVVWGARLPITYEAVRSSLVFALHLAQVIILSMVLTFTTTPGRLTQGLKHLAQPLARMGLPVHEGATILLLAMRFVPVLQWEVRSIVDAQKARGIDFTGGGLIGRARTAVAVLVPSIVGALRRGDTLAMAMSARGFQPDRHSSDFRPLTMTSADWLACAFVAAAGILRIALLR